MPIRTVKPTPEVLAAEREANELRRQRWIKEVASKCQHEFTLDGASYDPDGLISRWICKHCGGYKVLLGDRLDD
jgi:hypothetical protein